jgi:hypothetical protein
MTGSQSARGRDREVKVAQLLDRLGWVAVRAAKGPIDVMAVAGHMSEHPVFGLLVDPGSFLVREHCDAFRWLPMLVQVKSSAQGPYEHFMPEERSILSAIAKKCDSPAWLAYWPPNGKLRWIPESEWPGSGYQR